MSPTLKDHKLTGKLKKYRAFSAARDIRVVYQKHKKTVRLYGTHNQVY